jgi:hypothetical protein
MVRNEGSTPRKTPRQARSRATLDAILEAVAYILAALITELHVAMSRKAGPPPMRPSPTRGTRVYKTSLLRWCAPALPLTCRRPDASPRFHRGTAGTLDGP